MKWVEIDVNNLPKGEILAANFNAGADYGSKQIGYLLKEKDISLNGSDRVVVCDNKEQEHEARWIMANASHYIDLHAYNLNGK